MIFLSHNYNDKPIVEEIAVRLNNIFGQQNIFYDSWSIQPGDGIIDKMNEGLESCKFFFLFVSTNSLNSNMVKLEWQNALMKAARNDIKIVPIRIDNSHLPAILSQTLYLDLFSNGLEVILKQIVDVINGTNTFISKHIPFSNLEAKCKRDGNDFKIDIYAKHYMEPKSHYVVLLNNDEKDVSVTLIKSGLVETSFNPNLTLNNGVTGNGWFIGLSEATVPGFPLQLRIKSKGTADIRLITLLHEKTENNWSSIPISIA